MTTIYHITTATAWKTACPLGGAGAVSANEYRDDSLKSEGFIHCSTAAQLLKPANEFYHGQHGLILLCINEKLLTHPVIYEDLYDSGIEFPHIYGAINLNAIIKTVNFPPNADGSFSLPLEIKP